MQENYLGLREFRLVLRPHRPRRTRITENSVVTDIGANPSAEEQEEGTDEVKKTVIDVVHSFRLQFLGDEDSGTRAFATKKDFMGPFKGESSSRWVL